MKRFVFVIPLALGVLGLVSGCSSDEGGDAPASIDRESFPAKAAQAFCENVTDCCDEAGITQDQDDCVANAEASYDDWLASHDWLEVKYDGTKAPDCIAAIKRTSLTCGQLTEEDVTELAAACGALFAGILDAGELCHDDAECAGTYAICKKADVDDSTGKCAILSKHAHGKSGDDCSATCTSSDCAYDPDDVAAVKTACFLSDKLWCNDGDCAPIGDVGDACEVYGCKAGLYCTGGACAQQRTAGQPCDPTDFGACEEGTRCDLDTSECVALRAAGATCTANADCESGTCRGDVCAINNATDAVCDGTDVIN